MGPIVNGMCCHEKELIWASVKCRIMRTNCSNAFDSTRHRRGICISIVTYNTCDCYCLARCMHWKSVLMMLEGQSFPCGALYTYLSGCFSACRCHSCVACDWVKDSPDNRRNRGGRKKLDLTHLAIELYHFTTSHTMLCTCFIRIAQQMLIQKLIWGKTSI